MSTRARNTILRKLMKDARAGKLGGMQYRGESGVQCAIGSLMPENVIKDVLSRGLNNVSVELLFDPEGLGAIAKKQFLKAVAPLTLEHLVLVQDAHDETMGASGNEIHDNRVQQFETALRREFRVKL